MSIRFRMSLIGAGLACGLLAGCAATPGHGVSGRTPPQDFAPGLTGEEAHSGSLQNDPSAPANTPLCGTAEREAMAMGVQNYPQPLATGNSCARNACFNTQTGTYIAADGTRRVCR